MLGDDVSDSVSIVILLALFRVGTRRGAGFTVKQNLTAVITGCFEGGLDQVHKPNVYDREFQLNVPEVTRGFLVLAVVGWAEQTRFDDTHVRVHQTLFVGVPVVLVGGCRLDFNS